MTFPVIITENNIEFHSIYKGLKCTVCVHAYVRACMRVCVASVHQNICMLACKYLYMYTAIDNVIITHVK